MKWREFYNQNPERRIRVIFRDVNASGTLETTPKYLDNSNRSQRFFPPNGETAASLGWDRSYWYPHEIYQIFAFDDTGAAFQVFDHLDYNDVCPSSVYEISDFGNVS